MIEGKCAKDYPKQFQETTTNSNNGYPLYRRRNNNKILKLIVQKLTIDGLCHIILI